MNEGRGGPATLQQALRPRVMARNTAWNVVGQVVPLLVAAFTIPALIRHLGVDRFGVLTLAWALVGYFSLFDLGVGRALTKVVSDRLACAREEEVASAIWSGLTMMIGLGVAFGVTIWLAGHLIVTWILRVPSPLVAETTRAIYPLALCIPVITVSTALRGVLEAQHRFGLINVVRICLGVFNFIGPLVTAFIVPSIYPVVVVLVAGRILTACVYFVLCVRTTPTLVRAFEIRRSHCRELLTLGSWMTVSNIAGPVMVYLDRFLISAMLSVSLVAYYTTPFEVVTKLWIVPVAVTSVLFPAFAALYATDAARLGRTYTRGVRTIFAILFPAVFLIVLFAPEGIHAWLGPEFAALSTPVLRWIAVGVLVNSVAQVPYGLIQAVNRPDLTAKVHLYELPLYIVLVVSAVHFDGIAGAALAWTVRLTVEAVVLVVLARRVVAMENSYRPLAIAMMLAFSALGLAAIPLDLAAKLLLAFIVLVLFALLGWHSLLERDEKQHLRTWFGRPALFRD
ncbi:MAG: flippase [Terriglobales bacterium]